VLNRLVSLRNYPLIGFIAFYFLKFIGLELPRAVKLGNNVKFRHWAQGTVIHRRTEIQDDVWIFQGVTIGRADVHIPLKDSKMESILIKRGAIIGAGATILCKEGTLIVGENTIIGANSVLLKSTGENEIWAGNPAKKVGER
jgi:serine O-acetyltransferase